MPLDASIRARLDAVAALGRPPIEQTSPEEARTRLAEIVARQAPGPSEGVAVSESFAPAGHREIPVRVYRPASIDGRPPLVVYFHGGGWISGTLDTHDPFCRRLAVESGAIVVSVEYRLAPEHRFPSGPEDCLAATDWAFAQSETWGADAGRVVVAGDSAGGNLAAVVCLMRRDRGHGQQLAGQILLWPVTSYYDPAPASYQENGEGYGLTPGGMAWMWDLYLTDRSEAEYAYAAPLRAHDLTNLPPALVVTAEYDILRDEGDEYARRLRAAGIPVEHQCVPGVNHGFAVWPDADPELAQAKATRATLVTWLRKLARREEISEAAAGSQL